jgi:hypothetical protein
MVNIAKICVLTIFPTIPCTILPYYSYPWSIVQTETKKKETLLVRLDKAGLPDYKVTKVKIDIIIAKWSSSGQSGKPGTRDNLSVAVGTIIYLAYLSAAAQLLFDLHSLSFFLSFFLTPWESWIFPVL